MVEQLLEGEIIEYQLPMNRSISLERIYNLGNYQNIQFSDTINNIPEDLALDSEFIRKLRYLQFLETETAYRRYIRLGEKLHSVPIEESIPLLETEKLNLLEEIKSYFTTKEEE